MKSVLIAVAALVASSSALAVDSTLLLFDFNSGSAAPSFVDSKLENVGSWNPGSVSSGSLFIPSTGSGSFTFDVASGFQLDLSSISFNHDKSGPNPVGNVKFDLSLNGTTLISSTEAGSGGGTSAFTNTTLMSGLTGTGNTFSFTFDANKDTSLFELDDFQLFGSVSAVPEPTTVFGLAAAGFASVYFARRRKKAAVQAS